MEMLNKQQIIGIILIISGTLMFFTGCLLGFGLSTTFSNIVLMVASAITIYCIFLLNDGFADED